MRAHDLLINILLLEGWCKNIGMWTDGRTDGQTDPLIEMRGRINKVYEELISLLISDTFSLFFLASLSLFLLFIQLPKRKEERGKRQEGCKNIVIYINVPSWLSAAGADGPCLEPISIKSGPLALLCRPASLPGVSLSTDILERLWPYLDA